MRKRKFWFTVSGILVMVLMLPTAAGAASKYKVLYRLNHKGGGYYPDAALIFDTAGNLYGTTVYGGNVSCNGGGGCGTVFKLTPNSGGGWTKSVLYRFCSLENCADGTEPNASLIFDAAGNLYGTTLAGGGSANHGGTVFKLVPGSDGSWTESVLHSFTGSDGQLPVSALIFDQAGNLYGTTLSGGDLSLCNGVGCGVVFKLMPSAGGSWTESVLHSFKGGADGAYPGAGLIFDAAGDLYSTTEGGGGSTKCGFGGCGTVFKLKLNSDGSWAEHVLHRFTGGKDGRVPATTLIFDAVGNLYGTTPEGGDLSLCNGVGCGVAFKLKPNLDGSWTESVLHSFTGRRDGVDPQAGLIFDTAGNLFGTTLTGGDSSNCTYGCGTVFKLTANSDGSWEKSVLHFLLGKPASLPGGGLVFDKAGNLYSTTIDCGSGEGCFGVVFEVTP